MGKLPCKINYIDHRIYDINTQIKIAQNLGYETVTDAIYELYLYQISIYEIASIFKTCRRTICDWLHKIGFDKTPNVWRKLKIPIRDYDNQMKIALSLGYSDPLEAAKNLYQKNYSLREIGNILQTSKTCQKLRLKKIGVKLRSRGGNNYKNDK